MENKFIFDYAHNVHDYLIDIRRHFHMYPELGKEEFNTSKKICSLLDSMNVEYENIINTGVYAIIKNGDGPCIATRADIDALPILEENDVKYKSQNEGKMHACGHDAHTTIQLGVIKFFSENKDKWSGTLKFFFQPAEETTGGAKDMINEGVMKNPKVDAVFGLHMNPEIETGKIGVRYGEAYASSDRFGIKIKGVSAHGALPHNGIDTIVIAASVINAIQTISSRSIDPREAVVVSIGTINGGNADNVITNLTELRGTIRTLNPVVREKTKSRFKEIIENTVKAYGGEVEIDIQSGYDPVINEDSMTDLVKNNVINMYGEENLVIIDKPRMEVEDFSYFLQEAKGSFFQLGTKNIEKDTIYNLHHSKFNIDEDSIKYGVSLQIKNVLEALKLIK